MNRYGTGNEVGFANMHLRGIETMTTRSALPKASIRDTLSVLADVVIPNVAKGPIIRRPKMVALVERLQLDTRAVRRMQKVEGKYGPGPLMLPLPRWSRALILAPRHVHQVLDRTPEPFATETDEKRAALSHFEPRVALISHGPERAVRRQFNEDVLETPRPVHGLAPRFIHVVNEETTSLLTTAERDEELVWDAFFETWFRIVRRIVFGDSARDDHGLTDMVAKLRANANWAFMKPKQTELRERFLSGIEDRIAEAEPGSLAGIIATMPKTPEMEPVHQVAQWLFAFDPTGMATFRALALLASHPDQAAEAWRELAEDRSGRQNLSYLRACILESLRLWPTTPLVLRQTTSETEWETGTMPADTGILIYAPFFHQDDRQLSYAHLFSPGIWLEHRGSTDWPLIPFSAGPAICPATNLVQMLSSAMLAALINEHEIRLKSSHALGPDQPLTGTLNNYALRFKVSARLQQ